MNHSVLSQESEMSIDAKRLTVRDYAELVNHPKNIILGGKLKLPAGRVTQEQIDGALALKPISGDIFVTSYPKSGTTWLQAIVWWIINVGKKHSENGSIESMTAPTMSDLKRHHQRFIDLNGVVDIDKLPTPRVLVTHLPYDLVPKPEPELELEQNGHKSIKYIHVIRDPKDAVISYFHMVQMIYKIPDSDLNLFIEHFIRGTGIYGDYFDCIKSWWHRRYDSNILLVFYEEMLSDPGKQIVRIGHFLSDENINYEKILKSNESIVKKIIDATSFKSMKERHENTLNDGNREMAKFFRKGISGDWTNYLTESQVVAINDRIRNELGQPFVHMYVKRN